MPDPHLYVIDDGTLDTVIACDKCPWQGRYNPWIDPDDPEDNRIDAALELAAEDHDCS